MTGAISEQWRSVLPPDVKRASSPAVFTRGRECAQNRLISALELVDDATVRARASGSNGETYVVKARLVPDANGDGVVVAGSCTCPAAEYMPVCKHVVALALTASDNVEVAAKPASKRATRSKVDPLDQLAKLLDVAPKQALVEELLDAAAHDASLRTTLTARLVRFNPGPIDVSHYKSMLQRALRVNGHMHWRQTSAWAGPAQEAIAALGDLVDAAPKDAVKLSEYAFKRLESAYGRVDDSGGELTMLINDIRTVHEAAIHRAGEHPVKLARRLYELETQSELDVLDRCYVVYADALGETGRAEFRALAERDWDELAYASEWGVDFAAWSRRRAAGRVLEQVARDERDSNRLAEVVGDGFDNSVRYEQVVDALFDIDDLDGALHWAQDGLEAFPGDSRIETKLVDVYMRRGEVDAAVDLAWSMFERSSSTTAFERLRVCAEAAEQWDERRTEAFKHASTVHPTQLADLHLHGGDADAAWQAAGEHGTTQDVKLRIAKALEPTRGAEAATYYLSLVDDTLERASKSNYQRAVALLARADVLLTSADERAHFDNAIEELRTGRHRRKTSLIGMLDARGW